MSFDPDFGGHAPGKRPLARRPVVLLLAVGVSVASTMAFVFSSLERPEVAMPATPTVAPPAIAAPAPAPSGEGPGYHLIVNRETGRCLDVPFGSKAEREPIEEFPVNGGPNQRWRLEPARGEGTRIVGEYSGLCLEVPGGAGGGVAVEQGAVDGGPGETWRLEPVEGGWIRIVDREGGMAIEVPEGSPDRRAVVRLAPVDGSARQHWRAIAVR